MLEHDRAVHEVEATVRELRQAGVRVDAEVESAAVRVELPRALDHPGRDVHADAALEAVRERARQAAEAAAEVQRLSPPRRNAERPGPTKEPGRWIEAD